MRKIFGLRPRLKSNFTSYQERCFENLSWDLDIVFATADKNLGPVAVTLERYIKDELPHLQDESTYEITL